MEEFSMKKIVLILAVSMVLGLSGEVLLAGQEKPKEQGAEGKAVQKSAVSQNDVIATVGDEKITKSFFDSLVGTIPSSYRNKEGNKKLLDKIIETKTFAQEARRLKLDEAPQTKAEIQIMTDQVLQKSYMKQLMDQIKIGDDEIKSYYTQNKDKYKQEEQVRARHILVKTEEEAKAIAEELKTGKDFAELAKEKSTCPSSRRGGDLDWFGKGQMAPEFEKAAFALQKGQVSDIVHTDFGYHIIKLDDRKEAGLQPFEEVSDRIKSELMQQKFKDKIVETEEKLKKELNVQIVNEEFK